MRATLATLTALPLLTASLHLGAVHPHVHGELHRRVIATEVVVVTKTVYTTVTQDSPSSTAASTSVNISESSASVTMALPTSSSAATLKPPGDTSYTALPLSPNHALIVNSCDYDVFVSSIGDESCGPSTLAQRIPANTTYTERIRICYKSGVSLKVARTAALEHPMQFEYTVWDDKKTVSYDISYLDCMVQEDGGAKTFDKCVGHEKGIQAVAGSDCPVFQCEAGVECAQQAYTIPEFGYLPGAPVGACNVEQGIAFELCAENRT
ncbi:hypothetical protein ACJQWK_10377 [Exserohilum turcicum]|uniref:Uncharacterized protein n=1 Tax=Exserohilum turcicum (strain 28A) TaxID=671987 RepID=R0IQZ3_EXST2|nr:uncharacterized protein SETTUDRAFT_136022 [Exserohilum turcica Et28A]EOA87315.1 hypothetical protein SETTUDRAFT_136022 [Exserohilum turcica Et28A]